MNTVNTTNNTTKNATRTRTRTTSKHGASSRLQVIRTRVQVGRRLHDSVSPTQRSLQAFAAAEVQLRAADIGFSVVGTADPMGAPRAA